MMDINAAELEILSIIFSQLKDRYYNDCFLVNLAIDLKDEESFPEEIARGGGTIRFKFRYKNTVDYTTLGAIYRLLGIGVDDTTEYSKHCWKQILQDVESTLIEAYQEKEEK